MSSNTQLLMIAHLFFKNFSPHFFLLSPVVRSEFGIALVDGTGTGEGNLSTISHLGFPK